MAELDISSDKRKGFASPKKLSTRVDLTPMVDLGFLLITFFIFTYHMSKPQALNLAMPTEKGDSSTVGESTALTIIPANGNSVFYYHGSLKDALRSRSYGFTNYSLRDGIGNIIRGKQLLLDQSKPSKKKDMMLIIKPAEDAKFENVVNILDEALINAVAHYAIVDISVAESLAMASVKK